MAVLDVDPAVARVYEHGWQSWSPTTTYALGDRPHRPVTEQRRVMNYRPDRRAPDAAFQGEGLLAVQTGIDGQVYVVAAPDPEHIPSIRATVCGDRVEIAADGAVTVAVHRTDAGVGPALAVWAEDFAAGAGVGPLRDAPTLWCSWYHYGSGVGEADIDENLMALDDLDLGIDVVQIDDGWQAELGDWLAVSDRFPSLAALAGRIRDRGRRAGIWVAPFLVGHRSRTFAEHPDWLVGGGAAGAGWDQDLAALDTTSPGALGYLREVFGSLRDLGFDFFKLDFLYAGAVPGTRHDPGATGVRAYRAGLDVIRASVGPDAYLLGCGAPLLPSVGLVDAMRVSPDISPRLEPPDGDQSQPSVRAAMRCGRQRAWQHGRFWANDPDCLIAAPSMPRRADWAEHIRAVGGVRSSSDRLRDLDEWGLAATRSVVVPVPAEPFSG